MADIKMVETGDGGDFVLVGANLQMVEGFQNMPYLGLYGGNIEQSTKEFRPNEQRFDFWGNSLLMLNKKEIQFNSETERLLNNISLTSAARLQIENAVKSDLDFFRSFSSITVSVSIAATDRVEISVEIVELPTQDVTEFVYIWDSTLKELIQIN